MPTPLDPSDNTDAISDPPRRIRIAILLLGLLLPQVLLFGPSLVGSKILLPLDLLKQGIYLFSDDPAQPPANSVLYDQVQSIELRRQFATREVRQGRLPLWNPHCYCGAPFLAANNTAVFSPFRLVDYAFPGPQTHAWVALLRALVAGVGAYLFFRRALRLLFWPSALIAWCFPLTGFLVGWLGYPPSHTALWLPWMLLAVDRAVARPTGLGGPALAGITALTLFSGHAATAAQVLVGSGLYFVGVTVVRYGVRDAFGRRGLTAAAAVGGGWLVGFLLSGPQTLPTLEYLQTSFRIATRGAGQVETTSQGWTALPQLVLPYAFGHHQNGALYLIPGNRLENAASGYPGLLIALVLAPLAWRSRRARGRNLVWAVIAVFALGQTLGIPVLEIVFDVAPMKYLRNNRLVFLTTFALLALGATGLDALLRRGFRRHWTALFPVAALGGLAWWSFARAITLPEPLRTQLQWMFTLPNQRHRLPAHLRTDGAIAALRDDFWWTMVGGGALCVVAIGLWVALWWRPRPQRALPIAIGLLALGEMTWNARGVNPQCDPALYYPRLPALEQLANHPPGRSVGALCLPPTLTQSHGLYDLRGYDGADPAHLVRMLDVAKHLNTTPSPPHARTFFYLPQASPITDMLGLRYMIRRGLPDPGKPILTRDDVYSVVPAPGNPLPRPYVPRRVEVVAGAQAQWQRILADDFAPAEVAFVDGDVPFAGAPCAGSARIVAEIPSRITMSIDMQTPGVVVLADLWFPGWNAYLDGRPVPVLRTNYGIRSAVVPAGKGTLEFRYEPASFTWGLACAAVGLLLGLGWVGWARRRGQRT